MAVTLFISDIHLDESRPVITNTFLEFLTYQASQADAVYILGDLFDFWIGDDVATEFHQTIIRALQTLTEHGIPIYVMAGNRDFLMGKQFAAASGCQILADPTVIDLYGRPTLIMHGDTLCTKDIPYLKFRKIVRNSTLQTFFLKLPLSIRKAIARMVRRKSRQYTAAVYMDVTPEAIPHIMEQHHVTQLIHGHTHRPAIHYLQQKDHFARRIVLGDWDKTGHMLAYSSTGEMKLITF